MSVRMLRLDGPADIDEIERLTGRRLDDAQGWAAVIDGKIEHGSLAALARSGTRAIAETAERMLRRPPPLALRRHRFDWNRAVVMGIVNVTPDSFSDGGRFIDPEVAIAHGLQLAAEGAEILDIGGESTRPKGKTYGAGAAMISEAEELARVVPVIRGLRERSDVLISIDTRKAKVADAALDAGADIVNDVTGLIHDPEIADVVAKRGATLALMHTPRDIEELDHEQPSTDILADVLRGIEAAIARAKAIPPERLIVDPGIGFGKTVAHNLYLLRQLSALRAFGLPILVGASRKASIARAASGGGPVAPPSERIASSVTAAVLAYLNGAHILRVHDVRPTVEALRVAAAIQGATGQG